MDVIPTLVGYVLFGLAVAHAMVDGRDNRTQRLFMIVTLLVFGTLLEYMGISSGSYQYPREKLVNLGPVPLSVSLAWVGLIYSLMIIGERLRLPWWSRILATTLIALSLDWGMDPVAVHIGAWTWSRPGAYFGVPLFNFVGWFFIPIAYLLAYGLSWDRERRRPTLLTIAEIDHDPGFGKWGRLVYTILLVVPVSLVLLSLTAGTIGGLGVMTDTPFAVFVICAVCTVLAASGVVILKRENLCHTRKIDLVPPAILLVIGINYTFFGFITGRPSLGVLMFCSAIPLWLVFFFSVRRRKRATDSRMIRG